MLRLLQVTRLGATSTWQQAAAAAAAAPSSPMLRMLHLSSPMKSKSSVASIKAIRKRTGLPINLVRQALSESNNEVEQAIEWLQNNEEARAEMAKNKRSGRDAAEGQIAVARTSCASAAAMVQLACETDFVARNEAFGKAASDVAQAALNASVSSNFEPTMLAPEELAVSQKRKDSHIVRQGGQSVGQSICD
eukprot:UC1_evm1s1478